MDVATLRARAVDIAGLIGWILLCFASPALAIGSGPGEWYAQLNKPSWNPPNWIFGPVWTALYLMMGVSAWRVWRKGALGASLLPLGLFLFQLALNAAWTPVFFGLHQMGLALAIILVLWGAIAATLWAFQSRDRVAAALLVPYLAWVSFATLLNATLWRLNT
jgi:benzodiazapine receptor